MSSRSIANKFKIRASSSRDLLKNGTGADKDKMGLTSKGIVEDWVKEQLYGRKKEFTSKYTTKGTLQEDLSIDLLAEHLDLGMLLKNEKRFENDFMTGTPDIVLKDPVIEVKSSWDVFTFPYLAQSVPNKDMKYVAQVQTYMALTGKKKAILAYCLVDTPQHLIEREARNYCYDLGYPELDGDVYNDFEKRMTYGDIDPKLRVKIFHVARQDNVIEAIENRVKEAREYIKTLEL